MATRLYGVATTAAPISPAFTAGWISTTGALRRTLSTSKAAATEAVTSNIASGAGNNCLAFQLVSEPLAAQTITGGSITLIARGRELATTNNVDKRWRTVKVVSNDGTTVRGTLTAMAATTAVTELPATLGGKVMALSVGTGTLAVLAGDRIVVEIGFGISATGTTPQAETAIGGNGTDHTTTEGDTTGTVPWVEFSQTLVFLAQGAAALTASASLSAAGTRGAAAAAPLAASASLSAAGTVTAGSTVVSGAAALAASATLSTAGKLDRYRAEVAADTGIGWWHFDETSGTVAADADGTNPGTIVGSPTLNSTGLTPADDANKAITFSASVLQYVEIPNSAALNPTSLTIEALIDPTALSGGNRRIMQKGLNDSYWQMIANGSTLEWTVVGKAQISVPLTDNNRHHVAGSYDQTTGRVRLVIDGRLVAEAFGTPGALSANADPVRIAGKPGGAAASDGFPGIVDEPRMYGVELSLARLKAHADAARLVPERLLWKGDLHNIATRSVASPYASAFSGSNAWVGDDGYLHLLITNTAGATTGAEIATITKGRGYGTYKSLIGTKVDDKHPCVVIGGMFTGNFSVPDYGNREIDLNEYSMWSGLTGPCQISHTHWQSSVPGDPTGARVGYNASPLPAVAPTDSVHLSVLVWEPGKVTYRTYNGPTESDPLYREDVVVNGQTITAGAFTGAAVIPIPGNEEVLHNLWVCPNYGGGGDPTTVPQTEIVFRDFSFTALPVSAGLAASASLSAAGTRVAQAAAPLAASAALSTTAVVTRLGVAPLVAAAALSTTSVVTRLGVAPLVAAAVLGAAGTIPGSAVLGAASLVAAAALTAAGTAVGTVTSIARPGPVGIAAGGTVSTAYPAAYTPTAGHLAVVAAYSKHTTEDEPTIVPGWQRIGSTIGGVAGSGEDAGRIRVTVWARVLDGNESSTFDITLGASADSLLVVGRPYIWASSQGGFAVDLLGFDFSTSALNPSAVSTRIPDWVVGDQIMFFDALTSSVALAVNTRVVSATGLSYAAGSAPEQFDGGTTVGPNMRYAAGWGGVTGGSPTSLVTHSFAGSGGASTGVGALVRVRSTGIAIGAAALVAAAVLGAGGTVSKLGVVDLAASAQLSTTAVATRLGVAPLVAAAALSAAGTVIRFGSVPLVASAALTAAGTIGGVVSADLAAAAVLSVSGQRTQFAVWAVSAQATLSTQVDITRVAAAGLSGSAQLVVSATAVRFGVAPLVASAALTAAGTIAGLTSVDLAAAAALLTTGTRVGVGAAALAAAAVLAAVGTRSAVGAAPLVGTAALSASAVVARPAVGQLVAAAVLGAAGTRRTFAAVSLAAQAVLFAAGIAKAANTVGVLSAGIRTAGGSTGFRVAGGSSGFRSPVSFVTSTRRGGPL